MPAAGSLWRRKQGMLGVTAIHGAVALALGATEIKSKIAASSRSITTVIGTEPRKVAATRLSAETAQEGQSEIAWEASLQFRRNHVPFPCARVTNSDSDLN